MRARERARYQRKLDAEMRPFRRAGADEDPTGADCTGGAEGTWGAGDGNREADGDKPVRRARSRVEGTGD